MKCLPGRMLPRNLKPFSLFLVDSLKILKIILFPGQELILIRISIVSLGMTVMSKWICPSASYDPNAPNHQGPVHPGQYHPRSVKEEKKVQASCTGFTGAKFSGISLGKAGKGGNSYSVKTYKDSVRNHMIKNGMWDMFFLPDPTNKDIKWDLFYNHSRFPLKTVIQIVENMKKDATVCDSFGLQNLEWSGEYLRNSVTPELLNKVLREVPLTASGPEMYVAIMNVCFSDSYEALEETKAELRKMKLTDFPRRKCCRLCS